MSENRDLIGTTALSDEKLAELRAVVEAAAAREVPGGDYVGIMLHAAPKLVATIAARDVEIDDLRREIRAWEETAKFYDRMEEAMERIADASPTDSVGMKRLQDEARAVLETKP